MQGGEDRVGVGCSQGGRGMQPRSEAKKGGGKWEDIMENVGSRNAVVVASCTTLVICNRKPNV